jgi:hypothetical protein
MVGTELGTDRRTAGHFGGDGGPGTADVGSVLDGRAPRGGHIEGARQWRQAFSPGKTMKTKTNVKAGPYNKIKWDI